MAIWVKSNGEEAQVKPKNGKAFTLPEMQGFVGGYIEALRLTGGLIMWLNEDGKRLELSYNIKADILAKRHGGISRGDFVVGDVLIATPEESGEGADIEDYELLEEP
jgi:hypothetical protein